jgi:hypothetical protein
MNDILQQFRLWIDQELKKQDQSSFEKTLEKTYVSLPASEVEKQADALINTHQARLKDQWC